MTTTKNGTAAQGVATKPTLKIEEKSSAVVRPAEVKPQAKILTVESRKAQSELFGTLLKKHEGLKDVNVKLEAFVIGSDEHSQTIEMKDSKGNSFRTGRPETIKSVIELVRSQIAMQMGKVETEILEFIV